MAPLSDPLLVTDAPHLLYRGFFALPDSIKGTDGHPVNALLGSVNQTLCVAEEQAGGTAYILTGDRDMFQCATDSVHVLMQRARQEGPDDMGPAEVLETYGVTPEQVPDFIALRGDPSDGLPGAKGIGAKTAADLLKRKGDLEHVILGAVREKPSVRRALIEQASELRAFRDIATLREVEVELPPDRATDWLGGAAAARELGMNRLAGRLGKTARG